MEQRKTVTWSCRLEEKKVAELRTLIDSSGKTAAEFMDGIILIQQLSKVAEEAPMSAGYLQQLQTHTNGILNCFGQLASGMQSVIDTARADGNSRVAEVERKLGVQEQRNKELAETIAEQDNQIKQVSAQVTRAQTERDTARRRVTELEQNVAAYSELAESAKLEATNLRNQLLTGEAAVKAADLLRIEMDEMRTAHLAAMADAAAKHQAEIDRLQSDFSARLLQLGAPVAGA